jgi:hypothetical protein
VNDGLNRPRSGTGVNVSDHVDGGGQRRKTGGGAIVLRRVVSRNDEIRQFRTCRPGPIVETQVAPKLRGQREQHCERHDQESGDDSCSVRFH